MHILQTAAVSRTKRPDTSICEAKTAYVESGASEILKHDGCCFYITRAFGFKRYNYPIIQIYGLLSRCNIYARLLPCQYSLLPAQFMEFI